MLRAIIDQNRLFSILHEGLVERVGRDDPLAARLLDYANLYIQKNALTQEQVEAFYTEHINSYRRDTLAFRESGLYPYQIAGQARNMDRIAYDITLLLSTLFTWHRYRIMELLQRKAEPADRALFVGVGPGIEILLTRSLMRVVDAYDTHINPFLRELLPGVNFCERLFTGSEGNRYGQVFLIEILEHLADPWSLLLACKNVLGPAGKIHFTTATDIPQFDHLFNFPDEHAEFERWLRDNGFSILYRETLPHSTMPGDIGSKNEYYIVSSLSPASL